MGQLHLVGATRDWHVWHTVRASNGSWTQLGDIEGQAGGIGNVLGVACAGANAELHVCAVSATRLLLGDFPLSHTLRRADGSWTPFGNVEQQAGEIGNLTRVSAATIRGELHVCAMTGFTRLWHTIRRVDGSWLQFGDVLAAVGGLPLGSGILQVSCANANEELHVCAVGARLWHAVRRADGSWTPLGDVGGQAGERGILFAVGCAGIGNELHVCAISSGDFRLWHTVRRADGSWTPFGNVEGQTGEAGQFRHVALAGVDGELHVAATTIDGSLLHTIRRPNGSWLPFGDVEGQAGNRGLFDVVSIGATT